MKKFPPRFFMLVAFLACLGHTNAANYYFSSSTGDDSRSFAEAQNQNTPWRSISKFNEIFRQLQPGDAVYFKRGEVFYGGMYLDRSGNSGSPITIGAYDSGAKPIISGFSQATQWTSLGNGIYESEALGGSTEVNMVVINGVNYAVGRFPNANAANAGYLTMNSISGSTITSQELPGSPDWDGAQLVMRSSHWTFERLPVSNHSGNSITYSGSTSYDAKEGYGFFIQRHRSTLDQFGEWYFNPSTRKLSVYFGSQAPGGSTTVLASTVEVLADVRGSHILMQDLTLQGANNYCFGNNGHTVDNFTIRNCDVRFSGMNALFFQGADRVTLENSTIENTNNCAARMFYSSNTTLRSNTIRNTGMQPGMGGDADGNYMAILSEASGFVAEYNHIINTGYTAIRMGNGDNLIKNNLIDNFCSVLDDGAGVYAYNSNGNIANRKITGNIILNGVGANPGTRATTQTAVEGIYLDDNARDIEVSDNTVAWCGSNGIFVHNVQHFILRNNTFFNNTVQALVKSDHFGNSVSDAHVTENIYFSKEVGETVFHIYSDANDIGSMGTFNTNYYVRPLYNHLPLQVQYQNGAGVYVNQPFELSEWQSTFGHGQNSKKSPVEVDAYSVNGFNGGNRLSNQGFNNDVGGVWCFSAYSDCDIDWVSGSPLDGGALQVAGPSPSRIGMNCGALAADKHYIVRFSAAASQLSSMEIYYMQAESPWATISSLIPVQLTTDRQDYEILISYPTNELQGTIQFQFGGQNTTYWLDNMEMYEADVTAADPDDYIRFEYNPTTSNKTVNLNGSYVDGKNNAYSGSLTLGPYQSAVLIRTEGGPPPPDPDEDGDGVPDAEDQCPGSDDTADADTDGVPDGCDACAAGNDNADSDLDGVPDGCDVCQGYDDSIDSDADGVPDGCDRCPGSDDSLDEDNDGVPDGCDQCPGSDDSADSDEDGIPDGCDDCDGIPASICPSGDCPVNGSPIPSDTYTAGERITSNGQVANNGQVVFQAGDRIELKPGFKVEAGGSFQATIFECEQSAGNTTEEFQVAKMKTFDQALSQDLVREWKIYPNPLTAGHPELNVEYYAQKEEVQLAIIDQFGRTVSVIEPAAEPGWNLLRWDIGQLPAGTYYLYHANAPALARKAYPFVVIRN